MNEATAFAKQEYMEQETMTLEQAEKFVRDNLIKITEQNNFERCVDGRYDSAQELGVAAKPGGSAGDVLVAFGALNLLKVDGNSEMVLNSVINYLGGIEKFKFHTDQHAEDDQLGAGMGCGHLKHARKDPVSYGLTQEQMEFLFGKLGEMQTQGAEEAVLKGDHQEKATIIIDSQDYSLKPLQIMPDGTKLEAFVYQKTLDEVLLTKLSEVLQKALLEKGIQKDLDEVHRNIVEASNLQRAETLKRLTSGLPRYLATINSEGQVKVEAL